MAAAGNVYHHEYEGVRLDVLWRTVAESLPALLPILEAELEWAAQDDRLA